MKEPTTFKGVWGGFEIISHKRFSQAELKPMTLGLGT